MPKKSQINEYSDPCKTWVHDSLNVCKDKSCTTLVFYILSYIIYRHMTLKLIKGVQGIASKYYHPNKHNGAKASKGRPNPLGL